MNTFLTFLLVAIILYLRNRETQKRSPTNPQINPPQNETDAEREMPPVSDSQNAGEVEQVTTSEVSTAVVPSQESTGCAPHHPDGHSQLQTSCNVPPPAPTLISSYHEIVAAIIRCVCAGDINLTEPDRTAEAALRM